MKQFIFFFLVPLSMAFAQTDSLVRLNELSFATSYEKDIYIKLLKTDSLVFEAFLAPEVDDVKFVKDNRRNFFYQVGELGSKKREKNNQKYIKRIYNELHSRLLRKYEELVTFDRIFDDGWYNCVTACAIYGLAFEQLEIPYVIKETPTHVYILVYPKGEEIIIETTDPVGGFRNINESFKANFVALLQQQKVIDNNELRKGVDEVFNEFYYSASEIDLPELVGIQYYNSGIEKFRDKAYYEAFENFKKAYLLYDKSDQIREMLFASISTIISMSVYDNLEEFELLGQISRYESYDISNDQIISEFGRATQNILISRNDVELYDSAYYLLDSFFSKEDSLLKNEISYVYNYERARVLFNRAYYEEALEFSKKAYEIKPESIDSETLLMACFSNAFKNSKNDIALDEMNSMIKRYPLLLENIRFGSLWQNLNLAAMFEYFIDKKYSQGFEMKRKFEAIVLKYPEFEYDKNLAGSSYAQVVAYYFRKGQITNARKALNQGFTYAPNHSELKARQYMINN